jgi:hypothetical protein
LGRHDRSVRRANLSQPSARAERWRKALKRPITVEQEKAGTLEEMLFYLARKHDLVFELDVQRFKAIGIEDVLKKRVKIPACRGRSLESVLADVVRPLGGKCRAGRDCIEIVADSNPKDSVNP